MSNGFVFSVSNATKNARLNAADLNKEIAGSAISKSVTSLHSDGDQLFINFNQGLDPVEVTILDAVIASHEGNGPVETATPQLVEFSTKSTGGINKIATIKPDGQTKTYISHNFCTDGSAWQFDNLGQFTKIYKAEVQFTMDVIESFNTNPDIALIMDVMAGPNAIPSEQKVFNTIFDVSDLGNQHHQVWAPIEAVPTMGGGLVTVIFDYTDAIGLDHNLGMGIRFSCLNDQAIPGTHCSVSLVAGPGDFT